jgi:hypothetical protein
MIPLDQLDWTKSGDRTNWCTSQQWWVNGNIFLEGASGGPTQPAVGDSVTISVGVQGVQVPDSESQPTAVVQNIQAWACYPSPTAGTSSVSLVLPSLNPNAASPPTPKFSGTQVLHPASPSAVPSAYEVSAHQAYAQVPLAPTWNPSNDDLVPPNTTNSVHCCMIVASGGLADASAGAGGVLTGTAVGTPLLANSQLSTKIDICDSPYQGQLNLTLLPMSAHEPHRIQRFGFLAASSSAERRTQAVLEVTPIAQPTTVDPFLLSVLKAGPYGDLPLQPGNGGLTGLRLSKNHHQCGGWLGGLIREAEEIFEEIVEHRSHSLRDTSRLRVTLPPEGLQHLMLEVELESSHPVGTVHAFDVIQTEESGKRGGIRVATIVVPEVS